jgi:hypothetical protein
MKIIHVPFLLVLLGVNAYLRDIFQLPLYGVRILFFDMYLLLIGLYLYTYTSMQTRLLQEAWRSFLQVRSFVALISIIFVMLYLNFSLNILNQEYDYFFIVQTLNFTIGFIYLYLIICNDGVVLFVKSLSIALWLMLMFQFSLQIIGTSLGMSGEILSNRNGIAYVALFFYILHSAHVAKRQKRSFMLVASLALVNQTNGIFLLLLVCFLHLVATKTLLRVGLFRRLYIPIIFSVILLGSYFGLDLVLLGFGLSPNDLVVMEESRYSAQDNITSLISRLGSVPYTIDHWLENGLIFGLGPEKASKLLFWGYPVHNYFASVVAITGIVGLIFSLTLIVIMYNISKLNVIIGVMGLFFMSVSNDLSLFILLCFIPLMINSLSPSQKLNRKIE